MAKKSKTPIKISIKFLSALNGSCIHTHIHMHTCILFLWEIRSYVPKRVLHKRGKMALKFDVIYGTREHVRHPDNLILAERFSRITASSLLLLSDFVGAEPLIRQFLIGFRCFERSLSNKLQYGFGRVALEENTYMYYM